MDELIGNTAGKIWSYLDTNGQTTALKLKSELEIPNSLLHLALGWLSREGKVSIAQSGHTFTVELTHE